MSRPHKIKSYSNRRGPFGSGPRRPWWKIILSVAVVVGLVFLGISIYKPVTNFLSGKMTPNPTPEIETEPVPTPEPEKPAQPEPEKVKEKQAIKGAVLPIEAATDPQQLNSFLDNLEPEINTIFILGKDSQGSVYFETTSPEAELWGAVAENPINIKNLAAELDKKGLDLGVKISIFSDPVAARGNMTENAVLHSSGVIWIDNTIAAGGKPWITPYSQSARDYNLAYIKELADYGAEVFVLDHVMFPNDPTGSAIFGEIEGISHHDILSTFVNEAKDIAGDKEVGLFLTSQQVSASDSQSNTSAFGGDPTKFPAELFVVSVDTQATLGISGLQAPENIDPEKVVLYGVIGEGDSIAGFGDKPFIVEK